MGGGGGAGGQCHVELAMAHGAIFFNFHNRSEKGSMVYLLCTKCAMASVNFMKRPCLSVELKG